MLLAFGDSRRDEDRAVGGLVKAVGFAGVYFGLGEAAGALYNGALGIVGKEDIQHPAGATGRPKPSPAGICVAIVLPFQISATRCCTF